MTPDEVDELDVVQLEELMEYLKHHPPTHILTAAYYGFEHREPERATRENILAELNGG